jgi:hypothetical protein
MCANVQPFGWFENMCAVINRDFTDADTCQVLVVRQQLANRLVALRWRRRVLAQACAAGQCGRPACCCEPYRCIGEHGGNGVDQGTTAIQGKQEAKGANTWLGYNSPHQ